MEIEMTARATGPFGELNRRQRLSSPEYPVEYLQHLVAIGIAFVHIDHAIEKKIEVKLETISEKKSSSASQPARASRKKTARKSKT